MVLITDVWKQFINNYFFFIYNLGCPAGYLKANPNGIGVCVACLYGYYYIDGRCMQCPVNQSTYTVASIGIGQCQDTATRKNIFLHLLQISVNQNIVKFMSAACL